MILHLKMMWKSVKLVALPFIAMALVFTLWCAAMTYSQYVYEQQSGGVSSEAKVAQQYER